MSAQAAPVRDVVLVVDVANVVGSRPDGWWRDRAGASERLLTALAALKGTLATSPHGDHWRVVQLVAVLEGQARDARAPGQIEVVRATGSGDDALVARVHDTSLDAVPLVVVTADRGLRSRLPAGVQVVGPGWLRDRLDDDATKGSG